MTGIFGWSYPPGCHGTPYDDMPDDSVCVYCGQDLPEDPEKETWAWHGFCDAECCAREYAANIDDKLLRRAVDELARRAAGKWE